MNTELLHTVLAAIEADFNDGSLGTLKSLSKALQETVNNPSNIESQNKVKDVYASLRSKLSSSPLNDVPESWDSILKILGIKKYLGVALKEKVENIFNANQITPLSAASEIADLHKNAADIYNNALSILSGFRHFGIRKDEVGDGECEIGFLIPRDFVNNELPALGKEFQNITKILLPFIEYTTGSRPTPKFKTLSTTDPMIILAIACNAIVMVGAAIEQLLSVYEKILNIRKLKQNANDLQLEGKISDLIQEQIDKQIKEGLHKIRDELLQRQAAVSEARKNELRKELYQSLEMLLNRLDHGVRIELRIEQIAPTTDDVPEEQKIQIAQQRKEIEQVREFVRKLNHYQFEKEPVLNLPDHSGEDENGPKR